MPVTVRATAVIKKVGGGTNFEPDQIREELETELPDDFYLDDTHYEISWETELLGNGEA
jgi:hypothetical protein